MVRIDVHAARDFLCHGLTVAGQHDNFIDAVTAHLIERLLHLRANRVLNADDADELFITGDVKKVLARQAGIEGFIILNPVFGEEFLAAHADDAALIAFKVGDICLHAAGHDGLRRLMMRRFPFLFFDVFLDGHSERMHRMHLCRSSEQNGFFLLYTLCCLDKGNLRDTDGQRARLVEHDRIRLSESLDVVAALDEDAALSRCADGRRNGRSRRELEAAREIDEQQIEHALPIPRCAVDDSGAEE